MCDNTWNQLFVHYCNLLKKQTKVHLRSRNECLFSFHRITWVQHANVRQLSSRALLVFGKFANFGTVHPKGILQEWSSQEFSDARDVCACLLLQIFTLHFSQSSLIQYLLAKWFYHTHWCRQLCTMKRQAFKSGQSLILFRDFQLDFDLMIFITVPISIALYLLVSFISSPVLLCPSAFILKSIHIKDWIKGMAVNAALVREEVDWDRLSEHKERPIELQRCLLAWVLKEKHQSTPGTPKYDTFKNSLMLKKN